ncbi:MAG: LON peptidase substrate-binding domain-containing protein [Magnetovibrio sp.]|nr:LON peptidase substrate-binding domain-containing protein [Magnetovibrio sp.]
MISVRAPLELPTNIPLFPLSGVILLPGGHVPLNIYEPRYISMIDNALGQARIIGIVQPKRICDDPIGQDEPLFDIGTTGRIIHFSDPGNGRYHITLEGISRFRITGLNFNHDLNYHQGQVDFSEFTNDLHPTDTEDGPGKEHILSLMKLYFEQNDIDADWTSIGDAPYEALVSSLAMSCPFEATEKQALLECSSPQHRANMLISLFKMNIDSSHIPGSVQH